MSHIEKIARDIKTSATMASTGHGANQTQIELLTIIKKTAALLENLS